MTAGWGYACADTSPLHLADFTGSPSAMSTRHRPSDTFTSVVAHRQLGMSVLLVTVFLTPSQQRDTLVYTSVSVGQGTMNWPLEERAPSWGATVDSRENDLRQILV